MDLPSEVPWPSQPAESAASFSVGSPYVPRRAADVLELDMGDGLILYNHRSSLVHHLNPSAGIVWRLADGSAPVDELAQDIARALKVDGEEIRNQLSSVLAEMEAMGLVEDAGAETGRSDR